MDNIQTSQADYNLNYTGGVNSLYSPLITTNHVSYIQATHLYMTSLDS